MNRCCWARKRRRFSPRRRPSQPKASSSALGCNCSRARAECDYLPSRPALDPAMMLRRGSLAAILLACGYCAAAEGPAVTYEQHVRPILKVHCFQCHGEEDEHQANLDLRLTRSIVKGGD